jgi:hypothetical protein
LTEVLQSFISERDFDKGRQLLAAIPLVSLVGEDVAVQAARNFRTLRTRLSDSEDHRYIDRN